MAQLSIQELIELQAELQFTHFPFMATHIGVHDYDDCIGIHSNTVWTDFIQKQRKWKEQLSQIDRSQLNNIEQEDLEYLQQLVEMDFFLFEVQKNAEKNPFQGIPGGQIRLLYNRNFEPFPKRLEKIVSILDQIPEYLITARQWLRDPVKIWVTKAISVLNGLPNFYDNIITYSEERVSEELLNHLQQTKIKASEALLNHKEWLETEILPKATGSWCLGYKDYSQLLLIRQVSMSIPEMEILTRQVIKEVKEELQVLIDQISPGKTITEVSNLIKQNHPSDFEEVLAEYRQAMDRTRKFIVEKDLCTIPEDEKLEILMTPDYLRPFLPIAAYSRPAKYDAIQHGLFWVTPPEKDNNLLQEHNYGIIGYIALHEGYPGHHLQSVHSIRAASFAKMLSLWPTETTEGWALYCEEMMEEHGFTLSPEAKFEQLRLTLHRAIRVIVDIQMGTGKMSVEEATNYFIEEALLEKGRATAEAIGFTSMPTYFTGYLVGAYQIKQLKEQSKKHLGKQFNEKAFHDLFLSSGFHRITTIKQKMIARGWLST